LSPYLCTSFISSTSPTTTGLKSSSSSSDYISTKPYLLIGKSSLISIFYLSGFC
jgi:hypothetical protein